MARKRFISQDDLDDLLDLNDSYSEEFSDLSDSEDDVHALYVPSDSDESSSVPPTEKKQRPTKPCRVCTRNKKTKGNTIFLCCLRRPSTSLCGRVLQNLPFERLILG